jgi:type IV pilus assembly protein PilV
MMLLPPKFGRNSGLRGYTNRGMSMIEVLVGTLLIAFALLGLVSLQGKAVQMSAEAEDSQRAALLATELAGAMWDNNSLAVPATILDDWTKKVADATASGLPGGEGAVAVSGNTARITIKWSPPRAGGAISTYTTDVVMPVAPAASTP